MAKGNLSKARRTGSEAKTGVFEEIRRVVQKAFSGIVRHHRHTLHIYTIQQMYYSRLQDILPAMFHPPAQGLPSSSRTTLRPIHRSSMVSNQASFAR